MVVLGRQSPTFRHHEEAAQHADRRRLDMRRLSQDAHRKPSCSTAPVAMGALASRRAGLSLSGTRRPADSSAAWQLEADLLRGAYVAFVPQPSRASLQHATATTTAVTSDDICKLGFGSNSNRATAVQSSSKHLVSAPTPTACVRRSLWSPLPQLNYQRIVGAPWRRSWNPSLRLTKNSSSRCSRQRSESRKQARSTNLSSSRPHKLHSPSGVSSTDPLGFSWFHVLAGHICVRC